MPSRTLARHPELEGTAPPLVYQLGLDLHPDTLGSQCLVVTAA